MTSLSTTTLSLLSAPKFVSIAMQTMLRALLAMLLLHTSIACAQQRDPSGWIKCADEGGTCTLSGNNDVAFGANGKFAYKIGVTGSIAFNNGVFGDPIPGVFKAGYYKPSSTSNWTLCANEGGTCVLTGANDVSFGANGKFFYKFNVSGSVAMNNGTFGDPIPGVVKAGYYKPASPSSWTWCAVEGGTCTLSGNNDFAFGMNGKYNYKTSVVGAITFNNATFGDPIPGVVKAGYYKTPAAAPASNGVWKLGHIINTTAQHVMFSFHVPSGGSIDINSLGGLTMAGVLMYDDGILSIDPHGNTSGCINPPWRNEIRFGDRTWEFYFNTGTTLDITINANAQFTFTPGSGGQVLPLGQAPQCF